MVTTGQRGNNMNLEYLKSLFPKEGVKYDSSPLIMTLQAQGIIMGGLTTRAEGEYLIFRYCTEEQWWIVKVETLLDPNVKQWTLMSADTDESQVVDEHPLSYRFLEHISNLNCPSRTKNDTCLVNQLKLLDLKPVNPGGYESIKAMCTHYTDILTSAKIGVRENYQSPGHLIKMLETVEAGVLSDSKYGKWMRWLGYVQGVMVSYGLLDVTKERDRSRKLLSRLDHEFDNKALTTAVSGLKEKQ